jgi:hypothetical protein
MAITYEVTQMPEGKLIEPPASSTKFWDGYTAALCGTMAGIATSLTIAATIGIVRGTSAATIIVVCAVMALFAVPGSLIHVGFKRQFHTVTGVVHFFRVLWLSFVLGACMFLLVPAVLLLFAILSNSASFQQEGAIVGREMLKKMPTRVRNGITTC